MSNRKKSELLDSQHVFFELLKAGLWGTDGRPLDIDKNVLTTVQKIAEEHSVIGLITAGLEQVQDVKIPQEWVLQLIGQTLQIEKQNVAMNRFIGVLIEKMRKAGIYTLLVKGQGIAQCYDKPLWRECGDVDLFLSEENYEKAKSFLSPLATSIEPEAAFKKHIGLNIDGWLVELHGKLSGGLSSRMDKELDSIQDDTFCGGNVRSCMINNTQVFMLSIENDIMYVFSHILDHFYKGGIGLRQICDWSRLIWANRDVLNIQKLKARIKNMGLMSEWKAFGAFAVEYLGMPTGTMPFYEDSEKWRKKAEMINRFILEVGNFGHNRNAGAYMGKSFVVKKAISFKQRVGDICRHARIFPWDSLRFFCGIMKTGVVAAIRKS